MRPAPPAGLLTDTFELLGSLRGVVERDVPLAAHTRFGIGGPADLFFETPSTDNFIEALRIARASDLDFVVIGSGTNLIVSDSGYRGLVLRLVNNQIAAAGQTISVDAGSILQDLVDFSIARGLKGIETMTRIPGSVGAAIYGNAGAYGHSISESVAQVTFFDGSGIRSIDNAACRFHYRESIFKKNKDWIIFSADLALNEGDPAALKEAADKIQDIRDRKYPPTMRCAGSIFKNFLLAELPAVVAAQIPPKAIIEGKVPSAWFLEQVGAKGMRVGAIQVADYHANLIYNDGQGTARDLVSVITELKRRVTGQFGITLEEEVQYVGFPSN